MVYNKKHIALCPYCKKAIGIKLEMRDIGVSMKESKINQKTYEEEIKIKEEKSKTILTLK